MKPGLSAEVYLSCIILCRGEKPTEHYIGNFLPGFITKNPTNKKNHPHKKTNQKNTEPPKQQPKQQPKPKIQKANKEKKPKTKNLNKTIKNTKNPTKSPNPKQRKKNHNPLKKIRLQFVTQAHLCEESL